MTIAERFPMGPLQYSFKNCIWTRIMRQHVLTDFKLLYDFRFAIISLGQQGFQCCR